MAFVFEELRAPLRRSRRCCTLPDRVELLPIETVTTSIDCSHFVESQGPARRANRCRSLASMKHALASAVDGSEARLAIGGSRCRTISTDDSASPWAIASQTPLNPLGCQTPSRMGCQTPFHGSDAFGRKARGSNLLGRCTIKARPIPKSEIDWLMSTLSAEELSRFHRRYFLNDCQRRFALLDVDDTGLLSLQNLQDGLVDMFPTLKLDLEADGHHIPALATSLPVLIATFDADSDGNLDLDDFVRFVKFQQAWRAQFFLAETLASFKLEAEVSEEWPAKTLQKSCSLPGLTSHHKPSSSSGKRFHKKSKSQIGAIDEAWTAQSLVGRMAKDVAAGGAFSKPTLRPGSNASCSTRCSSRGTVDSSRGAFYSSFKGMSSSMDQF